MLLEIILFAVIGILAGVFTGLMPGIHTNLVGSVLVASSITLSGLIQPVYLIVLIVAMAITNTFIDFIPSIFLGCPDTETELSILPGHEMLKQGEGYQAIMLTNYGSIAAIFIVLLITPIAFFFLPQFQELLLTKIHIPLLSFIPQIPVMAFLLILVVGALIFSEKKKSLALLIFCLTGILGLIALNLNSLKEPLLPLLSGLFGASSLITSIKTKPKIPEQDITSVKLNKKVLLPLIGATIASPISSLLPGLGSGQAAVIGSSITKTDQKGFLVLLGATNTLGMSFSFITLYLISRSRTGAAAAIGNLLGQFSFQLLVLILIVTLFSGIISFFLTEKLARLLSKKISKVNYSKISWIILAVLTGVIFIISGFLGLIVFAVSTLTGIYCISYDIRRTHMMGCLLIPTVITYLTL
ncbi:MAG TPA: tripartite tricarboxylate transporter permease [Candidatus Pacearchaeota archaeon]|nr:tripartite tricarboxylate transporter permease [Candidatus Pacearchaeota archaeon]